MRKPYLILPSGKILQQAVQRIIDQMWAVDLHYLPKWQAWQPWLKGYTTNKGQQGYHFQIAWLEK